MANTTSVQILVDGPRNVVVKFEGVLDTSDLASTVVVDPATLSQIDTAYNKSASRLTIRKITYNIEDSLSINLFWDATTPVRIEELVGRGKMDHRNFGGLVNNAGAGVTGKITATTQGWAVAAILSFTIVIEMVKS
jgi:hypothetical protein